MSKEKKPLIKVENLSFRYSDSKVLDGANYEVDDKDFSLLIGPNGGGKTTLIKLLMGILKPQEGRVLINGNTPHKERTKMGYVPQAFHFDPQFPISVGEFVMLGAVSKLSWFGTRPKYVKEKAHALLEKVGLGTYFNAPFGSLSGGQKQRATLVRALIDDPEILLFDEPINNLDSESSKLFYDIVDENKGKRTIVMITHFVGDLFEKADKIHVVNGDIEKIDKEKACCHYPLGLFHSH